MEHDWSSVSWNMVMWNTHEACNKCPSCACFRCIRHCIGLSDSEILALSSGCTTVIIETDGEPNSIDGDSCAIANCTLVWQLETERESHGIIPERYQNFERMVTVCKRALELCRTRAVKADAEVLLLHILFFNVNNIPTVDYIDMLCDAASNGHPHANYYLGIVYGRSLFDADYKKAVAHLSVASKSNHAWALCQLSETMIGGWGTQLDVITARTLSDRAVELGFSYAHGNISRLVGGDFVKINNIRDIREAHKRMLISYQLPL